MTSESCARTSVQMPRISLSEIPGHLPRTICIKKRTLPPPALARILKAQ